MSQFVGYHSDGYDGVPVSTGETYEAAQASAIRRVLSRGITHGGVSVRQNDDLTPNEFSELTKLLDDYFAATTHKGKGG